MRYRLIPFTLAGLLLAGCQQAPESGSPATPAADAGTAAAGAEGNAAAAPVATVTLAPTADSQVSGGIQFVRADGGLRASGRIAGLAPGSTHGFHIHENGDCSAPDGSSAGGHFNPGGMDHGRVDAQPHHGGDMPNVEADAAGVALVDGPVSSSVTVGDGGPADILGRAVIVHADPDDYTSQPTGNAGARLACGVIRPAG